MLMPKRTTHRKVHRLSYEGETRGNKKIHFGEYGLMAKNGAWISDRQIEAARVSINHHMKRGGKLWINIFPHMSRTQKPLEVRMGKGAGGHKEWVAVVKKGKVMFELAGVTEETAREAFRLAAHKLPIKCKFVSKGDFDEK